MKISLLVSPFLAAAILVGCGSGSKSTTSEANAPESTVAVAAAPETAAAAAAPETAAPETAAQPAETVAAAPDAGASVDGEWKAIEGSEAGYRVSEILQGQKTEGVGRTPGVTGSMTVAGTKVTAATFTFDMTKLASDSGKRDSQVQTRIMKTAEFPTSSFAVTAPVDFGKVPAEGETVKAKATGDLTVHGTTKPVTVDLEARRKGANVEVLGSLEITFADWGIENPSFKPFVEVGEKGTIEWLIVMAK